MTTFVNTVTPYLRILLPEGDYAQFHGGRLDLAEDDPAHAAVMAEAIRNPSISVIISAATCLYCGDDFTGDKAGSKLDGHMKEIHFDLWQKQLELDQAKVVQKEVKSRAGYACDVCAPIQTFGSADDLAEHAALLHANVPNLGDEGNTVGGSGEDSGRRPGEVEPAPAAQPARGHAGPAPSRTAARRAAGK